MDPAGRHVVVTGAAGGIGRALVHRFAAEGARGVVAADLDADGARRVAEEVGGLGVELDAGSEESILAVIAAARERYGEIDVFVSNAGIGGAMGGPEVGDEVWDEIWRVNVMSHVWASRALLPGMLERGEGYLVNTASAAGLLTQVGNLVYSVTKHAAVALAEWLSIEYAEHGVGVSCICPQGVRTPMLEAAMKEPVAAAALSYGGIIEPEDVAEALVAGMREGRMLILPHENVAAFMALKAGDPERWLGGMRRLARSGREQAGG